MSVLNPCSSSSGEESPECPLCLEFLELDDMNFYPCSSCSYQICRFCWNKIRTEANGLCPACRTPYGEDPADFKPLTPEELAKIKAEKRLKDMAKKQKISENRKHLSNVRVVQKNLVFVVGLPPRISSDSDSLKKPEYFGRFGKIHKVVINSSNSYAGNAHQGPSASAYVTYLKSEDALRAIQAVNNKIMDGRTLKASLGTTKYCSHFMKNQSCPKQDCMYLHELGDEAASFTKEEMQQGKHTDYEKSLHEEIQSNIQILSSSHHHSESPSSGSNNNNNNVVVVSSANSNNGGVDKSSSSSLLSSSSASSSSTSSRDEPKSPSPKENWPNLRTNGGGGPNLSSNELENMNHRIREGLLPSFDHHHHHQLQQQQHHNRREFPEESKGGSDGAFFEGDGCLLSDKHHQQQQLLQQQGNSSHSSSSSNHINSNYQNHHISINKNNLEAINFNGDHREWSPPTEDSSSKDIGSHSTDDEDIVLPSSSSGGGGLGGTTEEDEEDTHVVPRENGGGVEESGGGSIVEDEDDGLGFDPFIETQKALAEMLESESKLLYHQHSSSNNIHHSSHVHQESSQLTEESLLPPHHLHTQQPQQQQQYHHNSHLAHSHHHPHHSSPPNPHPVSSSNSSSSLNGGHSTLSSTAARSKCPPPPGFNLVNLNSHNTSNNNASGGGPSSTSNTSSTSHDIHSYLSGSLDVNLSNSSSSQQFSTPGFLNGGDYAATYRGGGGTNGVGSSHNHIFGGGGGGLYPHSQPQHPSPLDSLLSCSRNEKQLLSNYANKDWQDGLRALLPNISVSFGNLPTNSNSNNNINNSNNITTSSSNGGSSHRDNNSSSYQQQQHHHHAALAVEHQGHQQQQQHKYPPSMNDRVHQQQNQHRSGWNNISQNDWTVLDPAIVGGQLAESRPESPPNWIKANLEQLTTESSPSTAAGPPSLSSYHAMGSLLPGFENLGLQHNNGMNSSYGSSSASRHGGGSSSTSLHAAAAAAAAAAAHYGQHFHTPPHHHPQHWGQSTPPPGFSRAGPNQYAAMGGGSASSSGNMVGTGGAGGNNDGQTPHQIESTYG